MNLFNIYYIYRLFTSFTYVISINLSNNERYCYSCTTKEEAEYYKVILFPCYRAKGKCQSLDAKTGLHNFTPNFVTGIKFKEANGKKSSLKVLTLESKSTHCKVTVLNWYEGDRNLKLMPKV
jgi:hypothetical protein